MTEAPPPIDPRHFRHTLGRFATGVTVVTTVVNGEIHGMTANAVISVSLEPPLVLVSVENRANLHRQLPHSGRYGLSILAEDQAAISNHFAGFDATVTPVFVEKHGLPMVAGAIAWIVTRIIEAHPAGDHTLYIGQVEYLEWVEGRPLLYFGGKYRALDLPTP
jgi:flavin reductase (DIM6/NTAB) family NADH-FMN oxidoreductase RutF